MSHDCLTVRQAWAVYDRWLEDPKVEFRREPAEVDELFRQAAEPVWRTAAPKALGDCYLSALSRACGATLVTFDTGLYRLATRQGGQATLLK